MLSRLAFLFLVLLLGITTIAVSAQVTGATSSRAPLIPIGLQGTTTPVVLIFVDSLARDVATNPKLMPSLVQFAREGSAFSVEPCRDQLTYLCIRAALTGQDDSSLLGIADNFRPNQAGPPESLLSAITSRGGYVSVIGSNDFHPYRQPRLSERHLDKQEEDVEHVRPLLNAALKETPQLVIVSLANGDMVAHAHGVASPEYAAAFRRIDAIIATTIEAAGPTSNVVVFGDHGHDRLGRHLPGTTAQTWAVYHGPAFNAGFGSALRITDHRALLGTLLGVRTERNYAGPEISRVLSGAWVAEHLPDGLPNLHRLASRTSQVPVLRALWLVIIATLGTLLAWVFSRQMQLSVRLTWLTTASFLAVVTGLGYDAIRQVVHDHGDSPERALFLLVPIAISCALATAVACSNCLRPALSRVPWIVRAAVCSVVVALLLLLPTAYYYGSRRFVVLTSTAGLLIALGRLLYARRRRLRANVAPIAVLAFAAAVTASFYSVRQLGPQSAAASTWALDAALFTRWADFSLVLSKVVLYAVLIAPRVATRPLDGAVAAACLMATLLAESAGATLPLYVYAGVAILLLLGAVIARDTAPASLLAGALLLLVHLYHADISRLAPIELLLAATAGTLWVWRKLCSNENSLAWLSGTTVAIAFYLMFWPSVGFHLAGIDFAFMFQWVPASEYDKSWQFIALGTVLKVALPQFLVVAVARSELRVSATRSTFISIFAGKVWLLSIVVVAFALNHSMGSQQAIAMLSEFVLLLLGVCCIIVAVPWTAIRRPSDASDPVAARLILAPGEAPT